MKCEKCGSEMILEENTIYTSDPPMYGYNCPKCGNHSYSINKESNERI